MELPVIIPINLKVRPLEDFIFRPTELRLTIRAAVQKEGLPFVPVNATLTEKLPNGSRIETSEILLPLDTIAQAIDGFDAATMQPKFNEAVLSQILAGFGLSIAP